MKLKSPSFIYEKDFTFAFAHQIVFMIKGELQFLKKIISEVEN